MDANKLRKLAGLPLLTERQMAINEAKKKKEDEEDVPPAPEGEKPESEDIPVIITKIAGSVAKKFGIGDPDGGPSDDLTALIDLLTKVYTAGMKDGAAEKGGKKPKAADEDQPLEEEKWSGDVDAKKHPPEGLFADGSASKIATWLKANHPNLKSAMGSLNFYINRAGKNLSDARKAVLNSAKADIESAFGK